VRFADAVKKALVNELSPEKARQLLKTFQERFFNKDKHYYDLAG